MIGICATVAMYKRNNPFTFCQYARWQKSTRHDELYWARIYHVMQKYKNV